MRWEPQIFNSVTAHGYFRWLSACPSQLRLPIYSLVVERADDVDAAGAGQVDNAAGGQDGAQAMALAVVLDDRAEADQVLDGAGEGGGVGHAAEEQLGCS